MTNQNGDTIDEQQMFTCCSDPATDHERDESIRLILEHLGCEIVRTNATKHGSIELVLRELER